MARTALYFLLVLIVCGCKTEAPKPEAPKTEAPAQVERQAGAEALELNGPGGRVKLGDSMATAKRAFPATKGSQEFGNPMNLAILGGEGWAWADPKTGFGFEARLKDGKIVDLILTELSESSPRTPVKEPNPLGPPTRFAEGKTVRLDVWEHGADARLMVTFKQVNPLFGKAKLTMIGPPEDFRTLGYDAKDPGAFVKLMDSSAERAPKK